MFTDVLRFGMAFVVLILLSGGLGSAVFTPQVWGATKEIVGGLMLLAFVVGGVMTIGDLSRWLRRAVAVVRGWTGLREGTEGRQPSASQAVQTEFSTTDEMSGFYRGGTTEGPEATSAYDSPEQKSLAELSDWGIGDRRSLPGPSRESGQ